MLGTTLWLLIAIALVGGLLIDLAGAFGRAAVHAAADHAIESGLHDALADYQNQLANAHAAGAVPGEVQRTYQASPGTTATVFTIAYDVAPTTVSPPACSSGGSTDGPDAVGWLQCNPFIAESRVSLRLSVRVLDASGAATLAQREQYVTLRLFGEPPYSAPVGRKDGAALDATQADALAVPAHEGDSGGTAAGTLIHVRYECHDGAGSCANAAPPDPDGALRAGVRWQNGNQP